MTDPATIATDKPKPKKYKFRLLAGGYVEKVGEETIMVEGPDGKPRAKKKAINKHWKAKGNKHPIIATDYNLEKMFGSNKFQRVGGSAPVEDPEDEDLVNDDLDSDEGNDLAKNLADDYEKWSKKQLMEHAKAEDIDLGGARSRDEIIQAIRLYEAGDTGDLTDPE